MATGSTELRAHGGRSPKEKTIDDAIKRGRPNKHASGQVPRLVSWNLSGLTATFTCLMATEPVVIKYCPLATIIGWRLGLISTFKEKYCAIIILTTDRMP